MQPIVLLSNFWLNNFEENNMTFTSRLQCCHENLVNQLSTDISYSVPTLLTFLLFTNKMRHSYLNRYHLINTCTFWEAIPSTQDFWALSELTRIHPYHYLHNVEHLFLIARCSECSSQCSSSLLLRLLRWAYHCGATLKLLRQAREFENAFSSESTTSLLTIRWTTRQLNRFPQCLCVIRKLKMVITCFFTFKLPTVEASRMCIFTTSNISLLFSLF